MTFEELMKVTEYHTKLSVADTYTGIIENVIQNIYSKILKKFSGIGTIDVYHTLKYVKIVGC